MDTKRLHSNLTPTPLFAIPQNSLLQRTCACGGTPGPTGECEACRKKHEVAQLQRAASHAAVVPSVPPIVNEVLRSPGQPLDAATRAFMEPRFGHDFSGVRVHADSQAAESARAVNALAYTVGRDLAFADGQYATNTITGRRLLAHELAHVVQQGGSGGNGQIQTQLTISQPGDVLEQEADTAADRIMSSAQAGASLTASQPVIQRETPGGDAEKKPPEQKDAGEVVAEGLKTVAEQATDNNPQVKKAVIDPIKDKLKHEWGRLDTGEKAATVTFGAATVGMTSAAMLANPAGRKQLEGVNLATPFTLIPYMPLSSFTYTLPSGSGPDQRLFKFETSFKADDLLNLRTERRGLPKMSLGVNLQWSYDPVSERLTVVGGDASFGLVPGLSISGGAYKDIIRPPQTFSGSQGQINEVKKSIPEADKPQPIPDVRIMLNIDLMKFKPGELARQIKNLF